MDDGKDGRLGRGSLTTAALPRDGAELEAKPAADLLYHLMAAGLLLAEGQALREQGQDCRKLLSAGLYLKRWLEARGPASPSFTARQVEWLEPLAGWRAIEESALADLEA